MAKLWGRKFPKVYFLLLPSLVGAIFLVISFVPNDDRVNGNQDAGNNNRAKIVLQLGNKDTVLIVHESENGHGRRRDRSSQLARSAITNVDAAQTKRISSTTSAPSARVHREHLSTIQYIRPRNISSVKFTAKDYKVTLLYNNSYINSSTLLKDSQNATNVKFINYDSIKAGSSPQNSSLHHLETYSADDVCTTYLCGTVFRVGYIDPDTPKLLHETVGNLTCKSDGGTLYLKDVQTRTRTVVSLYVRRTSSKTRSETPNGSELYRQSENPEWDDRVQTIYHKDEFDDDVEPITREVSVAIVTQLKAERINTLLTVIDKWGGALVATVYVQNSTELWRYYRKAAKHMRSNVLMLFVVASEELYPINWLRNLGLLLARGKKFIPEHLRHLQSDSPNSVACTHVLVTDVDFVPSNGLHERLVHYIIHTSHVRRNPRFNSRAFVVPAFEFRKTNASLPLTKTDLKMMKERGWAGQFHEHLPYTHRPTNYPVWLKTSSPYIIRQGLCHRSLYEPYVAIASSISPYYPEVFIQRRFNKVTYFLQICVRYVELAVIPDGFLIHKPHPREVAGDLPGFNPCVEAIFSKYKHLLFNGTEWYKALIDGEKKSNKHKRPRGHVRQEKPTNRSSSKAPVIRLDKHGFPLPVHAMEDDAMAWDILLSAKKSRHDLIDLWKNNHWMRAINDSKFNKRYVYK